MNVFQHVIQLTIRESDRVDSQQIAQAVIDLGGIPDGHGFAFETQAARDAAYAMLERRYRSCITCVDRPRRAPV
jgi:hypothetical protein